MAQRHFLIAALAVALAAPANAQTTVDDMVAMLAREGYTSVRVRKTWLGRYQFLAAGPQGQREVVLNPATGVILRDYTDRSAVSAAPQRAVTDPVPTVSGPAATAEPARDEPDRSDSPVGPDNPDPSEPPEQSKDKTKNAGPSDPPGQSKDKPDKPGRSDPPGQSKDKPGNNKK